LQQSLLGGGEPAVDAGAARERVDLDERSWVEVTRGWLRGADTLFASLEGAIDWRQRRRWMYERMVDEPRLTRGFGRGEPLPHPALTMTRRALDDRYAATFGGLFLNYYRDGNDSVAFHRDRELRDLDRGLVAIVTLGAPRPFLFRPRRGGRSVDVHPGSGDLLVMRGRCHCDWEHGVPKVAAAGPRISVSTRSTAS